MDRLRDKETFRKVLTNAFQEAQPRWVGKRTTLPAPPSNASLQNIGAKAASTKGRHKYHISITAHRQGKDSIILIISTIYQIQMIVMPQHTQMEVFDWDKKSFKTHSYICCLRFTYSFKQNTAVTLFLFIHHL